ncbi:MAG: translation initiation factor IF-3 [Pseudomonadota bacterium]
MKVNESIRVREVRLIDQEGTQMGVLPTFQALAIARERGLDLVEVAPMANPPVCRIMDYGKYRYEQKKKTQEAKKKQASFQIKEIKLRPTTSNHDLDVKVRYIKRFLEHHDKVKVTLQFKGREVAFTDLGRVLMNKAIELTSDIAVVEETPKMEGRRMVMLLAPKAGQKDKKPEDKG